MTHPLHDIDDLAALWAAEPSVQEREALAETARRIGYRARLLDAADVALGIAIVVGVLLALVLRPSPVTLAVGAVAAAIIFWSTWNRHLLAAQLRELFEIEDRVDLIDLQIRRVRTALQRAIIGLVGTPPAILLFAAVTYSIEEGGTLKGIGNLLWLGLTDVPLGPAVMAAAITLLLFQVQAIRRLRAELTRLERLGGEYREEARLDQMALGAAAGR